MRDELGDRMKRYENVNRTYLMRRTPAIIRIDGKSFHTFTKGMERPFDEVLMHAMQRTMKYLCENIQGCVLGYTQSDEITLVLTDYAKITTDAWFGYNVQKMASVSASMATLAFNNNLQSEVDNLHECGKNVDVYLRALEKGAMFDSRVFSLPKEEVCNCLIWRQKDAIRNSISSVGRSYYSDKQLYQKSSKDIKEMLKKDYGFDWDTLPATQRVGSCCKKRFIWYIDYDISTIIKSEEREWYVDDFTPCFTEERDYIEELL